mmetsp:Transcript_75444/g.234073  ORF Transcript_75444/g.234073 Transcript_75444/m.234073 type:complete len:147 (-) Transcript_75444:110-550(-)
MRSLHEHPSPPPLQAPALSQRGGHRKSLRSPALLPTLRAASAAQRGRLSVMLEKLQTPTELLQRTAPWRPKQPAEACRATSLQSARREDDWAAFGGSSTQAAEQSASQTKPPVDFSRHFNFIVQGSDFLVSGCVEARQLFTMVGTL